VVVAAAEEIILDLPEDLAVAVELVQALKREGRQVLRGKVLQEEVILPP
jgi:hypothetical protein